MIIRLTSRESFSKYNCDQAASDDLGTRVSLTSQSHNEDNETSNTNHPPSHHDNQTLDYIPASQACDEDCGSSDENDTVESEQEGKKLHKLGAVALGVLGVGFLAAKAITADDDIDDTVGAVVNTSNQRDTNIATAQGNASSTPQPSPDFSNAVQATTPPQPPTISPAQLQAVQQMATQAASNAAATVASASAAAAGAAAGAVGALSA